MDTPVLDHTETAEADRTVNPVPRPFVAAIKDSAKWQVLVIFLSVLLTRPSSLGLGFSLIVFWSIVWILVSRNPTQPHPAAIGFARYGFLASIALSLIWRPG